MRSAPLQTRRKPRFDLNSTRFSSCPQSGQTHSVSFLPGNSRTVPICSPCPQKFHGQPNTPKKTSFPLDRKNRESKDPFRHLLIPQPSLLLTSNSPVLTATVS